MFFLFSHIPKGNVIKLSLGEATFLVETDMVKFASAIGTVFLNVALSGLSKKHSAIITKNSVRQPAD